MLQAVTLFLSLATGALQVAPEQPLTIRGELKEVPAQGTSGPSLLCEGTANLPNGVNLVAHLYYGKPVEGRELFRDSAIVKGGKFSQEFPVFSKKNFPGPYVARLVYDQVLQDLSAPNYPRTVVEFTLQIGGPADIDREGQAVRDQVIGEIRALQAIGDEVRAKLDEMKDKPEADRQAVYNAWHERSLEIRKHVDARKHPEYFILKLDLLADTGMEDLTTILMSSARCFVLNQRDNMVEGLTRLRQSCEYWIGEVGRARVQDFGKLVETLEECRTIARTLAEKPDGPIAPARRRFLELIAGVDRSVPPDFHETVLSITDRGTSFFNAVADKSSDVKTIHAELDRLLNRLAGSLRMIK